jgi:antitoxin component YwqK of YwqJK toxin-antitoxin module
MKITSLLLFVGALGLGATLLFGQGRESGADANAQTTYFASGQLESRVEYADGRRSGLASRYFANGTKQSEGRFSAGLMEGEWKFWNADGSLDAERTGTYHAGDKIASGSNGVGN